ncbi:hypothetical protein LEN26_002998 [Aphanomyces euteiches]|nr:hypothetical protein AeMF1_003717 [Aphanomyces euteiches]KAH9151865.1 hypothetical protein AeRB84_005630 [Aphanomyces euteiches]KAH9158410.1 hypothetical protein LEN26_002998 [Aphanomyces euteiches]KAH9194337.1 hypothetical protein AeNC1_003693 [Aphanomyces euteiches]
MLANPLPSRAATVRVIALGSRDVLLQDFPGRREFRHVWYSTVPKEEVGGICFCVDISDTIRFPSVALELQRLHEFQTKCKLANVWLLCTKCDCLPANTKTPLDFLEQLKTLYAQLTKDRCLWAFQLVPLLDFTQKNSVKTLKTWLNDTLTHFP